MRFLAFALAIGIAGNGLADTGVIQLSGPMTYTMKSSIWFGDGGLNAVWSQGEEMRVYFRTQPKGTLVIRNELSGEYHIFNLSNIEYGQPLNIFTDSLSSNEAPWTFIISGKVDGLYFYRYPREDVEVPVLTGAGHIEYTLQFLSMH